VLRAEWSGASNPDATVWAGEPARRKAPDHWVLRGNAVAEFRAPTPGDKSGRLNPLRANPGGLG